MSFEVKQQLENSAINTEKVPIYKERAFVEADKKIEKLKKIESGEIRVLKLDEKEKEELSEFENKFGEQLEKIWELKVNSSTFYPEYLLTQKGRDEFKTVTGLDLEAAFIEEVASFLLANREQLDKVDSKKLSKLAGDSEKYVDDLLAEKLLKTCSENGEVDFSVVDNPQRTYVILNPGVALEKIQRLRGFKGELKNVSAALEQEVCGDLKSAKGNTLELYRRRTNEMIAEMFYSAVWSKKLAENLGTENITEDEKIWKKCLQGFKNLNKLMRVMTNI